MPETDSVQEDDGLPPPGQRWGAGAHSVLPFLTRSLLAKPAEMPEQPERSPRERGGVRADDAPQARHLGR